ncbi:T-box transcription factor T homolog [Ixodes scapularis]
MAEGGSDCPDKAVPASPSPPAKVTVQLFDRALWSSLAKQCNEMEVSGSLRKLVPELIIKVSGLVEDLEYTLSVMFVPTDDVYYLYQDNTWAPGGVFVEEHSATVYLHPNGKMTGREWSSHFIKFPDLRLTTDPNAVPPKMFVDQRRYYQTVIVFTGGDGTWVLKLPELRFMAVPSIHNPHVKELKARRSEEPPPKTRRVSRKADGASSSRTPSQRTQPQEGQHPSGKNIPTPTPQSDSGASDVSSPMLALSGRQPAGTSSIPPTSFVLTPRDVPRDLRPSTSAHAVTSFIQPPPPARGPSDLFRDHRPGIATLSAYCRTSCIQPLPLVIASRSSQAFAQHPGALDLVVSELWDEEDYIPETDHNKEP